MKKEDIEVVHEAARLNEWYNGSEVDRVAYRKITDELNKPAPKKEAAKKPATKTKTKGKK